MLKRYVRPYTKRIVGNILVKMSGTSLEVLLPMILAHIVNRLLPMGERRNIVLWGLLMIACAFGAWSLNVTANRMASKTSVMAIRAIRHDLFERSLRLSARQLDHVGVSSLETRLTTDTYAIHRFLGATLRMGVRSLMLFVGGVVSCLVLSPRLSLILFFLILPLTYTIRSIMRKGRPLIHQVQNSVDCMVQVIRENIRGIRISKALNKTRDVQERYGRYNDDVKTAELKAIYQMAKMEPTIDAILFVGLAMVLISGALMAKEGAIQAGTIMAFLSYFIQITNSLLGLNRMFGIYNRAAASSERIEEILRMPDDQTEKAELAEGETPVCLPEPASETAEVEFRHVSFSYNGGQEQLQDVSFKIFPGESLGIMGATGAGKSTLIRLLLRQYDADAGEILIRGVPLRKLDPAELRQLFAVVFQNDFLFAGTLRENMDFGRGLDDSVLLEAAEDAQANEILVEKEGGLDFTLASKGVNLSGGQKQRVLLTRALSQQAPLLILDDASSALDFATEARLRKALEEEGSQVSRILIAQRVSAVRAAGQILFLENGRILARGTHAELLRDCLPYREIAEMQGEADASGLSLSEESAEQNRACKFSKTAGAPAKPAQEEKAGQVAREVLGCS